MKGGGLKGTKTGNNAGTMNGIGSNKAVSRRGHNNNAASSAQSGGKTRSRGFTAWLINALARLAVWHSLVTILLRCPSNLERCTESSPYICKPYFQVREAVTPRLAPYYDAYAGPYVEVARPYYEKLDNVVITPAQYYAARYAGPRITQAQRLAVHQWEQTVQPQLTHYQTQLTSLYHANLGPHVEKATVVIEPYYDVARTNALQTYYEIILPSYLHVQPYAQQGYNSAVDFTQKHAVPSTVWAWNQIYDSLDSIVWPQLRDLYMMKVEPQLVRIGERLGRYHSKKSRAAGASSSMSNVKNAAKSSTQRSSVTAASSTSLSVAPSDPEPTILDFPHQNTKATATATAETANDESAAPVSKEDIRQMAAKIVAEDIELWEGKYSKAAEESGAEIEERIQHIASHLVESIVNDEGKSLVSRLNKTVEEELRSLKTTISSVFEKHNNAETSGETQSYPPLEIEDQTSAAVRSVGLHIKDQAQEIRTWRQTYEQELSNAVAVMAEDHIKILDSMRDLALQKIGMKWAWMDGITYKHWQQYHQLRDHFDSWTDEIKRRVTEHPVLYQAQVAGVEIENEAMAAAGDAAQKLAKLKEVAMFKAEVGDWSEDFDIDVHAARAAAAQAATTAKVEAAAQTPKVVEIPEGSEEQAVFVEASGSTDSVLADDHVQEEPPSTLP